MNIQLNTLQVFAAIAALIMLSIFVTGTLRWIMKRAGERLSATRINGVLPAFSIKERNKYSQVNAYRFTGILLKYGLVVALSVSLLALSWTIFEKPVYIPGGTLEMEEVIEHIPRTAELPRPLPPPPPAEIETVHESVDLENSPDFISMDLETEDAMLRFETQEPSLPPPPPPPPPKSDNAPFVRIAEYMPRFPGCEDAAMSNKEKDECARQKMLEYIYKNLKYPVLARETNVEGTVVIQFVVDREGWIESVNIVRDIGGGCGEAAALVVKGMNGLDERWTPGKQRGRPVNVLYTLPVKFQLQ